MATTPVVPRPAVPAPAPVPPKPVVAVPVPAKPADPTFRPTPGGVPATSHAVSAAPPLVKVETVVGKTVKSIQTFSHGSVFVVDLLATDGNHYYIKTKQGALEIGGTADWDTGTKS